MHNDEDINLNLNPGDGGDGSPGGYYFFPAGPVDLTAADVAAQHRTMKLVPSLMDRLANDSVDMNYIIKAYQLVRDNHTSQKGKRRVPTDKGRELIIALYDKIADYRDDVMQTSDYGPYPSHTVYNLRCAMVDIIKMYDEYCAGIRDLIVPPMPQQAPTTLAPAAPPTAMPTEIAAPDKPATENDPVPDLEKLGQYFRGPYRGFGGNRDYFTEIIDDTMKLSTAKEVGMVAHLLFHGNMLNNKKPRTFSKWIRIFFKLLGKTPPTDTHKNKYKPDEGIRRTFAYLP